jgi:hypothetical protein
VAIRCAACGNQAEEGKVFCPACNAPLIRVPSASTPEASLQIGQQRSRGEGRIRWKLAMPIAFGGALAMLVLFALVSAVVGPAALLVIPLVTAGAVLVYAKAAGSPPMTAGMGTRIGLVTGFLGFALGAVLVGAELAVARATVLDTVKQTIERAAQQNPSPQSQEVLKQFSTPEGLMALLILTLTLAFFLFLIFGASGGAIAGAALRSRQWRR